jgi:hypothetical protein
MCLGTLCLTVRCNRLLDDCDALAFIGVTLRDVDVALADED